MSDKLTILDLFAGTGSATKAFEEAGHRVIKVELDERFEADERDVLQLTASGIIEKYGEIHFIWASPPCTTFSVASIGHHWKNNQPSKQALEALELVKHALDLIQTIKPKNGWLMENPRGLLRKQQIMNDLRRRTVTYCAYGDNRMKPTDLWGYVDNWTPRPMCKNGDTCHEAAPRGSRTGTQGRKDWVERSKVPYELSKEIADAVSTSRG